MENLSAKASNAAPFAAPICVVKSFEKKFQSSGWPKTLNIETRFAESIPSLKNFRPIPGANGYEPSFKTGSAADESLISPNSAPLNIPLNTGLALYSSFKANFTYPTAPTE